MKKNIVFFEVRGGSDKGEDGYRKDTMPMVNALKAKGYNAEVIFFEVSKKDEIYNYVKENFDAYVSRINPGNLKEENEYFDMLRKLCADKLIGMPHPDAMIGYGAKDALTKLADTDLVPSDTYAYYDIETFKENFPKSLAKGERVLKQNRGSTGEGIWRVSVESGVSGDSLPLIRGKKVISTSIPLSPMIYCSQKSINSPSSLCSTWLSLASVHLIFVSSIS